MSEPTEGSKDNKDIEVPSVHPLDTAAHSLCRTLTAVADILYNYNQESNTLVRPECILQVLEAFTVFGQPSS